MVKKGMDLKVVKKQLMDRKKELERDLQSLSMETFSTDKGGDVGDQAISSTMETLRNSLQSTEHKEYDRVVKSLEMIENGTYGFCSDCEGDISQKRLKYFPDAFRCLECQEKFEAGVNPR